MDTAKQLERIHQVGEEIVTEEDLKALLEQNSHPLAYDGFEPSGLAHLPFGIYRAMNIKTLLEAGVRFNLYLADYHAFVNNKLGGDMAAIHACGEYFVEVWKAAGVPMDKVNVVWASKLMDSLDYWDTVLSVGRHMTLKRALRATAIMGRKESDALSAAQLYYPSMQVADIFEMELDICQLGMDQRRANMLAREIAPKLGYKKPVAVHHHMLLGLQGKGAGDDISEQKMSKSRPETSIYVHDSDEAIKKKIAGALCPPKSAEENPMLDWCQHLLFPSFNALKLERSSKFGGNKEYESYKALEGDYVKGGIHPADLKNLVAAHVCKLIAPVRLHFEKDPKARKLYEIVAEKQGKA